MSVTLTPEALIEAAFASAPDPDPDMLATMRGDMISKYAEKQGVTALLRQILQKVLIDRPEDPVPYMIQMLDEWKPRTVLVIGPPASGKKTLSEILSRRLGLEHVSAGDLVNGYLTLDTQQALEMKTQRDKGFDMPSDVIGDMVVERLKEQDCVDKGWILEGWPSTGDDAAKLVGAGLGPQIGLVMEVPDSTVEDRISFRLFNPGTGRLYHMQDDPPPLGESRRCIVRPGESTKEVLDRIARYREQLPAMLAALETSGDFKTMPLDADCSLDDFEVIGDKLARAIGI